MAREKAGETRASDETPPPDDFDVDWDLIKEVNEEEANRDSVDNSDLSTVQDVFFTLSGSVDDETLEEGANSYNLIFEEKFDIFVDALAEDTDSEVELSNAEYSIATNFTQDTELTQETLLEPILSPQQDSAPIPNTINVTNHQ